MASEAKCGQWLPFHTAFALPEHTLIAATYEDWSGGEILTKIGDTFCDLSGEPSSMLADLYQYQIIGIDRCPAESPAS